MAWKNSSNLFELMLVLWLKVSQHGKKTLEVIDMGGQMSWVGVKGRTVLFMQLNLTSRSHI